MASSPAAARLRAAGLEDPHVLETADFAHIEVKFLYGDAVPDEAELHELGFLAASAIARVGLALRATLAGASERLEDSLWAARAEQRRSRDLLEKAWGPVGSWPNRQANGEQPRLFGGLGLGSRGPWQES